MSEVTLTRHRTVLNCFTKTDDSVSFWAAEEDGYRPKDFIIIERQDWEDFGSPDVITLTVEPGDLLNAR